MHLENDLSVNVANINADIDSTLYIYGDATLNAMESIDITAGGVSVLGDAAIAGRGATTEISITATGDVTLDEANGANNAAIKTSQDISINAGNLNLIYGTIISEVAGDIDITTTGDVVSTDIISAANSASIEAQGDVMLLSTLSAAGDVSIEAGAVDGLGQCILNGGRCDFHSGSLAD